MSGEAENSSGGPVERAVKLLRFIGEGNSCRNLSRASKELAINRTTLIRLIRALADHNMIEEIQPGAGYRLGPGLISLAAQGIHGRDIVQMAQPVLSELVEKTGLSAHLGILDGTDIVYLSRETPNTHLVSNVRAGSRLPAHTTSIGRAILAEFSKEHVTKLYEGLDLGQVSGKSPKSLEELLDQWENDRRLGYAWSEGNFEHGIGSCAAVIFDGTNKPAGGLNVSGPQDRFSSSDKAATDSIKLAIVEAAREVSIALGYARR
ncbi:transcriptional regulator, IclR family [Aliiroseovarius crassostreae]|uniref:IclR family transcriptional regulator n=1 Tax=Aliiroseovarius crassostreae TaxID=154981 RepID=A0A0P7IW73_9RHOB|nr:IclR family transcriptional regulator [Aliiroseovarius crassostreae]KPN63617.1 IclR family transcriptional regulator [Aliiroseovarius crassostreae]SFU89908.1 transcriptional regulator, IclR family [Aliiroseovarius crassostreae]